MYVCHYMFVNENGKVGIKGNLNEGHIFNQKYIYVHISKIHNQMQTNKHLLGSLIRFIGSCAGRNEGVL